MDWNSIWQTITSWALNTGIKILIALVVMFIAFKLINFFTKKLAKANEKKQKVDPTIAKTGIHVLRIVLKVLVVVGLVGYLGFNTSAISALVASLGVAAGLAVNGALGNIAGGVLLLITRPFRVGDFIEVDGFTGTVEEVRLCHTKMLTLDNKVVYIPNGTASGANVINYSEKEIRRVDLEFEISEEEDFEAAKQVLQDVVSNHEKILHDKDCTIRVCGSTDDGIVICCRPWVKSEDYWDVYFDLQRDVKKAFDKHGITIPFPQLDVHPDV